MPRSPYYLAPSLAKLRAEINAKWPRRDKRSDGWLGDAAHRARKSEHNPDGKGCVHAIDVDKDGIDVKALLREVIGDPRVWYVIFDSRIWSRTRNWKAARYTGANKHDKHVHISILLAGSAETNVTRWFVLAPAKKPKPQPAKGDRPRADEPGRRTLKQGMAGADVKFVQKFIGPARCGPADGDFDSKTKAGVRWYQRMRGLKDDGIVGSKTWAQMGVK